VQVVYSPAHLGHDITVETFMGMPVPANEVAERAERIRLALEADGGFPAIEPTAHGETPITAVHDPGLVRFLEVAWSELRAQGIVRPFLSADTYPNRAMFEGMSDGALAGLVREPVHAGGRAGFWGLDSAAPLVAGTYVAARAAVDVALTTVDLVLGGATAAYGLCRPPGHHAARSMYGGYCFFNNAAIAAEAIIRATGERVAILDVDYHHGNGSQQIFWRRGDVRYVSIHADPDTDYPYFLGRAGETGEGEGAGENVNLPLPPGTGNEAYLAAVDRALEAISAVPGSVVVVSLGFDTYGLDPIGSFALTTDVYHEIGRRTAALGRRLVVLQEGGYHRPSLGENARAWLRGAEGRSFDPLPAAGFGPAGAVAE
jgi:acetoin utilization deacetylase AcuC-like enzyme